MNFSLLSKSLLVFSCLVFLYACNNTKTVYKNLKTPKYTIPVIENLDNQKILLTSLDTKRKQYVKKTILNGLRNKSQYHRDITIINDKVFALSKNNSIQEFDLNTGKLIDSKTINFLNISNEIIISLNYFNNSFIIALKSGSILNIDLNGELIWKFHLNKILNTPLSIFDDQIIAIYVDEINSISSKDGSLIWTENYNDQPVYQAKGGQLVNFLNLLFFLLPNNKVGSIDLNLGVEHSFIFNEMSLISPINNTGDKIHIFDNYFVYLDEGKYLYTVDILNNNFILYKKNINSSSSNIFFNNSLIIKEGNYLHAVNISNGKSFWLINNKDISSDSSIIAARSIDENIEIFLDNGDILVIYNKSLLEIRDLDIKNIKSIDFKKDNIIVNTNTGKTIILE